MPVTVTEAPASAKAVATAWPMPLVPPVTSTEVPAKSKLRPLLIRSSPIVIMTLPQSFEPSSTASPSPKPSRGSLWVMRWDRSWRWSSSTASSKRSGYSIEPRTVNCFMSRFT